MIFITGDLHIPIDIHKLSTENFKIQKEMTKDDYVIICGDFGGVWRENDKTDEYWLKWLEGKNFTTLFVDGNHENFDLLNNFEVKKWNGGKVHFINDSVIHLMRGQVFFINGKKIFTMGGGASGDIEFRIEGKSWWPQEIPNKFEYNEAIKNLENICNEVDYIITHTGPTSIISNFRVRSGEEELTDFFEQIKENVKYKHWYFGHVHEDMKVDKKHTVLYYQIIKVLI